MKKKRNTVDINESKESISKTEPNEDGDGNENAQVTKKTTKKRRFTISQRMIIIIMVAISVAVFSYVCLEAIIRTVDARNDKEFDKRIDSCVDYVAYVVNNCGSEGDMRKAVGEIKTMAYSLSGRLLVIDKGYKVLIDSYDKDTDKYMADQDILEVMTGKKAEATRLDDMVYRKIIPVIDSEGYTNAVAVIAVNRD